MKTNAKNNSMFSSGWAATVTKLCGLLMYLASVSSHGEGLRANCCWIHLGGVSYHISNDSHRNGANYGLGLGYNVTETQSIRAGVFRNSYDRNAGFISYVWLPLQWGPMRIGASAIAAGGYNNRTGALVAILPWAEVDWKYAGIELGVAPVRNGIVTLQFKVRFD